MIEVDTDKTKNLLTIRFSGKVTVEDTRRHIETVTKALAELQPGFQMLTNLSRLESMDVACAGDLERTMDLANERSVKRIIRVIPDPGKDIGLNIMSLFHYRRGTQIVTCETLEQAADILAAG